MLSLSSLTKFNYQGSGQVEMGGALGGANISTAPTTNLYCRKHFKALKVIKTYVGGRMLSY